MQLKYQPKISLGIFRIGDEISNYFSIGQFEIYESPSTNSRFYEFDEYPDTSIYTTLDGTIQSINCHNSCVFNEVEMIGLPFSKFLEISNLKFDEEVSIFLLKNGRGQTQKVYEFAELGMQVWVYRKKIVSVFVSD